MGDLTRGDFSQGPKSERRPILDTLETRLFAGIDLTFGIASTYGIASTESLLAFQGPLRFDRKRVRFYFPKKILHGFFAYTSFAVYSTGFSAAFY